MANSTDHSLRFLGPWRLRFQWLTSLVVLLLPWVQVGGESALRIDVSSLSLHLFGSILHIEELYLFLVVVLIVTLGFFLLTLLFGRLWCGWACPQTTLSDIAEWLANRFGCRMSARGVSGDLPNRLLWHGTIILLAFLIGSNLVWYFIEPLRFFYLIADMALPFSATLTLLLTALAVYLDITFLRRLFCKEFCPYGRFQSTLSDDATLVLHRPDYEVPRCIECDACVFVCPMKIDIREGYQIECINCGRCLDACRKVMAVQSEPGLIHYHFGTERKGWRALINRRSLTLAGVISFLFVLLIIGIHTRQEATIKIAHSHTAAARTLADGSKITFFTVWINNRGLAPHQYALKAIDTLTDSPLELKGMHRSIQLAPGANRKVDIALLTDNRDEAQIVSILLFQDGREVNRQRVQVLAGQ